MTLKPKFLLILSLFQLSLGLGWIFGYLLIPPTVFFYERPPSAPCKRNTTP